MIKFSLLWFQGKHQDEIDRKLHLENQIYKILIYTKAQYIDQTNPLLIEIWEERGDLGAVPFPSKHSDKKEMRIARECIDRYEQQIRDIERHWHDRLMFFVVPLCGILFMTMVTIGCTLYSKSIEIENKSIHHNKVYNSRKQFII